MANFTSSQMKGDGKARSKNDFYPTPPAATKALLEREDFPGQIWEPACGNGAISKLLPPNTISSDLFDRGYGDVGLDFLETKNYVNHIITNPPYSLAQEFVEHSLECVTDKVALLLKLNFLEGVKRHEMFKSTPLSKVYVFSRRLSFDKGNKKGKGRGLLAYAWFVWDHTHEGQPTIDWILI